MLIRELGNGWASDRPFVEKTKTIKKSVLKDIFKVLFTTV